MHWQTPSRISCIVAYVSVLACVTFAQTTGARNSSSAQAISQVPNTTSDDALQHPLTNEQKRKNAKALKRELSSTYKRWLEEDVRYIITPEELAAFRQLSNDEERDQFLEQFWLRRDPTPDTPENEFREEHYRRIAYANEHFAAGIAGWRTDRGRIYVIWGAPDQIEAHPAGGLYERTMEEGGGETNTFPFERWRYRELAGIGQEITLEFVDRCSCNDYHLSSNPNEKDALLYTPGGGATDYEALGLASRLQRLNPLSANPGPMQEMQNGKQFDRLQMLAKVQAPPPVKFKDLEEVITHKISLNSMPFDVRTDYVRLTSESTMVPVTLQIKNRDVTFVSTDGIEHGTVHIFGRVTNLTGRVVQTFEDTVEVNVPQGLLEQTMEHSALYWKSVPLRPGRYRLDIVVKDMGGDRAGTWSRSIMVPEYTDDRLASSSVILADRLEKVASKNVGAGDFVIGETKLNYPHLDGSDGKPPTFARDQRVGVWMQIYNLQTDEKTKRTSASFEYKIVDAASNEPVLYSQTSTDSSVNVGEQITLQSSVPLESFKPGVYKLTIKVNDNVSKQEIIPSAVFLVK
jgi:GWxTD domain-containing protein